MCSKCVEALEATFPEVPMNERMDFMMSCTAFPCGSPELILEQLQELRKKTSDYKRCYRIVEDELDASMEEYKRTHPDE